MDQYDLKHLFDRFDDALASGREPGDPRRLRANEFMLVRYENWVATFKHLGTGVSVRFDARKKRIVA